jgi:hypothetical protein
MRRKCEDKIVDLHGKTADEAIDYFISHSNMFLASGQRGCLVVIHGYGSSGFGTAIIKQRIRAMVTRWPDYFEVVMGDDSLPGETWVVPRKPFPNRKGRSRGLAQDVCSFCETRKTEKQILTRFHQRAQQDVWKMLNDLREQGMLEAVMKNGQKAWRVPRPREVTEKDDAMAW